MSFFCVTVETIDRVLPHPNADRLELIALAGLGFPLVEAKGRCAPGQRVLYFPIDSVIPAALADRMGVRKYLAGDDKSRVKTAVLRGEPSQGIAASLDLLVDVGLTVDATPEVITAALGVTKFVPPLKEIKGGRLVPLPNGLSVFDIEAVERSAAMLEWLMDRSEIIVTEKLEGQNHGTTHSQNTDAAQIAMRENVVLMDEGRTHLYIEAAKAEGLPEFARMVARLRGYAQVTVYGELLGPGLDVGNYYHVPTSRVCPFALKADGQWLRWDDLVAFLKEFNADNGRSIAHVPLVFRGKLRDFLAGRTVRQASNGLTALNLPIIPGQSRAKILREGIVIMDAIEGKMPTSFSRVIIKQRDPVYLASTGH